MTLGAICAESTGDMTRQLTRRVDELAERLELTLLPQHADACWNRGAAFGLAMEHARRIVCEAKVHA
jgi:hypothetical protein